MPEQSGAFTLNLRLCDDAGMVAGEYIGVLNRLRSLGGHDLYDGEPFPCTGSAHLAGQHIRCTSTAHLAPVVGTPINGWQVATTATDALPERPEAIEDPLPEDLERLLRDPNISIPGDEYAAELMAKHLQANPEAGVTREAYLHLWATFKRMTS